jgi:Glycosyl hydrolase catalytic core
MKAKATDAQESSSSRGIESIPFRQQSLIGSPCCREEGSPPSANVAGQNVRAHHKDKVHNQKRTKLDLLHAVLAFSILGMVLLVTLASRHQRSSTGAPTDHFVSQTRRAATTVGEEESHSNLLWVAPKSSSMEEEELKSCYDDAMAHPPLPGKKGAAFTLRNIGENGSWWENLPKVIRLYPYWNYSWGTKRIRQQPRHIEFVPMLWGWGGNAEKLAATIANDILPQVQAGHVKRLLGFNEPDNPGQANLKVEAALEAWPILEQANLPLVSPSAWHPDREVRFFSLIIMFRQGN